jgi:hypothetical protein
MKIRNIKVSGMKQTRNVACTKRRAYRILQGKNKSKRTLGRTERRGSELQNWP